MQSGLAMMLAFGCARHATPPPPEPSLAFDVSAVDRTADPCADFYAYACGGWQAKNPIPAGESRWSRMAELEALNRRRVRQLVESARRAGDDAAPEARRVGKFYATCVDEERIEARGLEPIRELLASIAAMDDSMDATRMLGEFHARRIPAGFMAWPRWDPRDPLDMVASLTWGPLRLDEPQYLAKDEASSALRTAYVAHLGRLFHLLGDSEAGAAAAARRVLAFETALAQARRWKAPRDHSETRPGSLAEVAARYPSIDWRTYLSRIGAAEVDWVDVENPRVIDVVERAIASGDLAALRDTMRMHLAWSMSHVLPARFAREISAFRSVTHPILAPEGPREDRCRMDLERYLGHDVSRGYASRHFDTATRDRAIGVIDRLITANRRAIAATDWLGTSARNDAQVKLSRMRVVVGARDPPSVASPDIVSGDAFGNAWRVQEHYARDEMSRVGRSRSERFPNWLAHELHAFDDPGPNALVVSAGMLQPPVLDPGLDDAVNYGAFGAVVGHELFHLRDRLGAHVDSDGYMASWWSEEDAARHTARESCFADQYQEFGADGQKRGQARGAVLHNIADNAGVRLAYEALAPSAADPTIDGYMSSQRFFLSWGQINCETATPEGERGHLQRTLQASGRWRVNGSVMNMPEFAEAFSCSIGEPMAPPERCRM